MKTMVKTHLYYVKYDWSDAPHYLFASNGEMAKSSPDWALIRPLEIEVDIPDDFDPRPQQIDNLRKAKAEILAKAHVQAKNIEEQIQRLLCLEHKSEVA